MNTVTVHHCLLLEVVTELSLGLSVSKKCIDLSCRYNGFHRYMEWNVSIFRLELSNYCVILIQQRSETFTPHSKFYTFTVPGNVHNNQPFDTRHCVEPTVAVSLFCLRRRDLPPLLPLPSGKKKKKKKTLPCPKGRNQVR